MPGISDIDNLILRKWQDISDTEITGTFFKSIDKRLDNYNNNFEQP